MRKKNEPMDRQPSEASSTKQQVGQPPPPPNPPPETPNHHSGCWRGCFSFPNSSNIGQKQQLVAALGMSLVALTLSDAATDVCGFLQATIDFLDNVDNNSIEQQGQQQQRKVGINVYEDRSGECIPWRRGEDRYAVFDDKIWKWVRIFVGIAAVVSALLVLWLASSTCIVYPRRLYAVTAWLFQMVALLFLLSFVVFGSDLCQHQNCRFHIGAGLMIGGVLFWIPAAIWTFSLSLSASRQAPRRVDEESLAEEKEEEEPPAAQDDTTEQQQEQTRHGHRAMGCFVASLATVMLAGLAAIAGVVVSALN